MVLNYSCYCGVRIELAVGSLPIPRQYHLPGRVRPVWNVTNLEVRLQTRLQTSLGLEVKSLKTGRPITGVIQGPNTQTHQPISQQNVLYDVCI